MLSSKNIAGIPQTSYFMQNHLPLKETFFHSAFKLLATVIILVVTTILGIFNQPVVSKTDQKRIEYFTERANSRNYVPTNTCNILFPSLHSPITLLSIFHHMKCEFTLLPKGNPKQGRRLGPSGPTITPLCGSWSCQGLPLLSHQCHCWGGRSLMAPHNGLP